jgi:hypothetical protein
MILGEGNRMAGPAATLDDLFRRAGVRHPDALALADPPNREAFTDGAPRALSFAQADRAISAFAARLRGLGLRTDTVVALQLPNIVESIVALLGVLRAGMIAAPVPLLWRQQELVSGLGRVGAKVIVTSSRIGTAAHAEIAVQTAVELFPIRQVCGFGRNLPDGMVPLDDIFAADDVENPAFPARTDPAAAHIAAITFDPDFVPFARSHVELVAGGLETFLEARAATDAPTLSAIPVGSFAGISLTLLHWLLAGGTLHLHHGFDPEAFAAQCRDAPNATVMLPATAIAAVADAGLLGGTDRTVVSLWRSPELLTSAKAWEHALPVVDVASFGEVGVLAARRGESRLPAPLPLGAADRARRPQGAPTVIETARNAAGRLLLRGRMVPLHAYPPGSERDRVAHFEADEAGFIDTGFPCRVDSDALSLTVTAPPPGMTVVGGYRFRQDVIDAAVAQADPEATIVAIPDAVLGQRLAGTAADRAGLRANLTARGINPLVCGAFLSRGEAEAA